MRVGVGASSSFFVGSFIATLGWGLTLSLGSTTVLAAPPVDYTRDIRPILSNYCYQCHGPDTEQRKAGLRLDLRDGAFAPTESGGHAIVAGKPDESLLIERVMSDAPDLRMPPEDFPKKLSPAQVALLRRWIEEGASWKDHWAFITPKTPDLPAPKAEDWIKNPIDRFVLARLEKEGWSPSGEADKVTLIRRLTFDLTGLPPTPEEIDAYLADNSSQAYEHVVDRLLNSPRYGEHMARYWLDAARYGDTHGLHLDNYRSMWPYRDWVINAFNRNLSFDQFTIEQLAGDLLPSPTNDQRIASGFNRCNISTSEGGSIDEEYYVRYTVDRVETTSTVFLGMTLGCAVCHDHKFDPVTQREFYQLFAYFNNLTEKPMDGNKEDPPPILKVASLEQNRQIKELTKRIDELTQQLDAAIPDVDAAQSAWEKEWETKLQSFWRPIELTKLKSTGGATLKRLEDGSILAEGTNPPKDTYEVAAVVDGKGMTAVRLECLTDDSLFQKGPGRSDNANFVLSEFEMDAVSVADPTKTEPVEFAAAVADFSQANGEYFPDKLIDKDITPKNGWAPAGFERHENRTVILVAKKPFGFDGGTELRFRLKHESEFPQHTIGRFRLSLSSDPTFSPAIMSNWRMLGPFKAADGAAAYTTDFGPEAEIDLAKTYGSLKWVERRDLQDGKSHKLRGKNAAATYLYRTIHVNSPRTVKLALGSDDGVKVWLDGKIVLDKNVQRGLMPDEDRLSLDLEPGEHKLLMKVVNYGSEYAFAFRTQGENAGKEVLDLAALLSAPAPGRTPESQKAIRNYYRSNFSAEWKKLKADQEKLEAERKGIEAKLAPTLVMQEMDGVRDAFMLLRGEYDKKGEKVERKVPAVFPPLPEGAPNNRLGLAKWLVSPSHPLTARVTVNRFWQQLFGTGIVKTAEDFGIQGEYPSHPELLDWLATEFIRSGWDVKRLLKMMVMSSTYRQSSVPSRQSLDFDPDNRLLSHGPLFRMDAEVVRDNALAVSGLLIERVGGASVKPYQPPGVWEAVGYVGSNTRDFKRDSGEALYRRSLYTFWKRTAHPPALQTFDAPSREQCTVRRARTNTPLQALNLMNDEQYVEASRAFAERILSKGGNSDAERLGYAFRMVTARWPDETEREVLAEELRRQRERFTSDKEAATKLITVGESKPSASLDPSEVAAWTMIGNLLLNLHETITKG